MNIEKTKLQIISFIKQHVRNKIAILGLSGGIDSALVAYLAVEALGKEKVHTLILPSSTNTQTDTNLAMDVVQRLSIQSSVLSLEPIVQAYETTTGLYTSKKSLGNLKARIRMSLLYGKTNELDGIVLGTGNKTELAVGYFTKYGDGGVDLLPIGDLYKTEVRELATYVGVPQEIINRAPTAGLWEGQTDEGELGISYNELDKILIAIEHKADLSKFDNFQVERVKEMVKNANHKLKTAPVCIIK